MDEQRPGLFDRATTAYKGWPLWGRIAAPAIAVLLLIGALGGGDDDQDVETDEAAAEETTTTTESVDIDAVLAGVSVDGVTSSDLEEIVEGACSELEGAATTDEAAAGTFRVMTTTVEELDGETFDALVEVITETAPQLCPDGVEEHPQFLAELQALAPVATTTTSSTTTTTTSTTTTTTTTAPPPPPPPTTAAPAPPPPPAPSTQYSNCTEARAAGAAPLYRGDPGYGSHLDRDDDGVACE